MLFCTYLCSATCFPSLIIYKPRWFSAVGGDKEILQMTALGAINVGSYLLFGAIGNLVAIYF